ncbi:MAG: class I SAM-dependent RNA methyltransferase [Alphaproteobacteria bacterium]
MSKTRRYSKNKKRRIPPRDLTLSITEIGAGGDGVAMHDGMRIFVPKTMDGDIITARIEGGVKDGAHGALISIDTPSADRISAPCPHFDACGGCSLQHLGEEAYRAWKVEQVKHILLRAGIKPKTWEEPIFIPTATRRRTTLAVHKLSDKKIKIGYHAPRSHDITDISACGILDPVIESIILKLKPYLLPLAPMRKSVDVTIQKAGGIDMVLTGAWRESGDFTLEQHEAIAVMMQDLGLSRLSLRESEHAECEVLLTYTPIMKKFGALSVALPPAAFLQASDAAENIISDLVMEHIGDVQNLADLFCGCGTFAGHMIARGKNVLAIDSDGAAMDALSATPHPNLTTQRRNLFKEPLRSKELEGFDAIVFDPPRAGAKAQCEDLAYSDVSKIVAVSCNPATFARDAKALTDDGDYTLLSVRIVDQFIWSPHCEIVALFEM